MKYFILLLFCLCTFCTNVVLSQTDTTKTEESSDEVVATSKSKKGKWKPEQTYTEFGLLFNSYVYRLGLGCGLNVNLDRDMRISFTGGVLLSLAKEINDKRRGAYQGFANFDYLLFSSSTNRIFGIGSLGYVGELEIESEKAVTGMLGVETSGMAFSLGLGVESAKTVYRLRYTIAPFNTISLELSSFFRNKD